MVDQCHTMAGRELANFMVAISVEGGKMETRSAGPSPTFRPGVARSTIEHVRCLFVGSRWRMNRQLGSCILRWQLQDECCKHSIQTLIVSMAEKEATRLVEE